MLVPCDERDGALEVVSLPLDDLEDEPLCELE